MMRYLQRDTLDKKHLNHFDAWASTFGETTTAIELAPEGENLYLVIDRTHPVLLDALAKEYRVNYAEKKPSVMDKLKHSGSRNEPKICRRNEPER